MVTTMLEHAYDTDTLIAVIVDGWSPTRLAEFCEVPVREVKAFYKRHKGDIEIARLARDLDKDEFPSSVDHEEITESEEGTEEERISKLWISSKYKRLQRYQRVTDKLLELIEGGAFDATTLREARSFMMYVANELGQIPNRGAGIANMDGETATYTITGVDMEALS